MPKKMMHIGLSVGTIGPYVLLTETPEFSEKIAQYLDNPKEIAYNREFRTFSGLLNGTQIAVTSTGIGGPSIAIAVEELFQCASHTMIRVGTCESTSPLVHKGDIVIPNGAISMEGVSPHYIPVEYPPIPDMDLIQTLEDAATTLGHTPKVGVTITSASYSTRTTPHREEIASSWKSYLHGGALCCDMECAPLFAVGSSIKARVASLLVCLADSDQKIIGNDDKASYLDESFIHIALHAMKLIIERDLRETL
jgi:uridine phosphorylase